MNSALMKMIRVQLLLYTGGWFVSKTCSAIFLLLIYCSPDDRHYILQCTVTIHQVGKPAMNHHSCFTSRTVLCKPQIQPIFKCYVHDPWPTELGTFGYNYRKSQCTIRRISIARLSFVLLYSSEN